MNVFLTGTTGFCGAHIARRLLSGGHCVWALSRGATSQAPLVSGSGQSRLTILSGDLASLTSLPHRIDAVIHTAAVSPTPNTRIGDFITTNTVGTQRLVDLASEAGVNRFIFFSSLSVYGDILDKVADENTQIVNPSAYGVSKLLGEMLLRERSAGMSGIAFRLPAILGRGASRHWLATITDRAKQGQDIRIFNPDAAFNNAVHIDDLSDLVLQLLDRPWAGFDAITLGAEGGMSIREIALRVVETAGTAVSVIVDPAARPCFTVSSDRARTAYGYRPMLFSTMLARYLSERYL